jgi:hypothetical protein
VHAHTISPIEAEALRIGRLFAGSDGGGENWVIAATLIRTAILNEINPRTPLNDVLGRIVHSEVRSTALTTLQSWAWCKPAAAAA